VVKTTKRTPDRRIEAVKAVSRTVARVREAEEELRVFQTGADLILSEAYRAAVPAGREDKRNLRRVTSALEAYTRHMDSDAQSSVQATVERWHTEATVLAARDAVRAMRTELQPHEDEILGRLSEARSCERAARAKLEELIQKGV
jgi:hypothetical protein